MRGASTRSTVGLFQGMGLEVKNSTDLVESLLNLYGLEDSKPVANLGRHARQ